MVIDIRKTRIPLRFRFFETIENSDIPEPLIPDCPKWNTLPQLKKEKEVVGVYISGHPLDDFNFEIENFATASLKDLQNPEKIKGKKLRFAGIITESLHKETKNGNPFGILSIEDYSNNHRFFIFSDEYRKFKDFMVNDWCIMVEGIMQERKWKPEELEFKITRIEHLSEVREKMTKSITIKVQQEAVDKTLIDRLDSLTTENKGDCLLNFHILDIEEEIKVNATSNRTVELSQEFMNELGNIKEIQYKVN